MLKVFEKWDETDVDEEAFAVGRCRGRMAVAHRGAQRILFVNIQRRR
jgi:hypothetical protein